MTYSLPFTMYPIEGAEVACPLCGSSKSEVIATKDRRLKILPQVKCLDCGLMRHKFMPSEAGLGEYYRTQYRADYQQADGGPSERHVAKRHAEVDQRLPRIMAHLPEGARLVDFGCGSGEFVERAIAKGLVAQGFEPGSDYATYAKEKKGLPIQNCGWQDFALDAPVDVVTTFHVFEHLLDPMAAVAAVASWLKDDGYFYIEVPNAKNGLELKGYGSLHMAHTLGFARYSLELLGALNGFKVVEVFDEYDIGIVFQKGTPRDIDAIKADASAEFAQFSRSSVHARFWRYTFGKLKGKR
jgi:2-polyprenyl-3-methyl-5-hydroxy-6-metoxy-1,4-benzoquinol methylase